MHLTMRQLHYFVAIIDAGSMTRAAETLHVAPTALSLQLKALEGHFGDALVHRHSRGVVPTPKGSELYTRARHILDLVEQTELALAPAVADAPRLVNLGVPPGLARIVGVEAFLGVAGRLQGLALEVTEGWTVDMERKLASGDLDIVVGYGLQPSAAVDVRDLLDDRLVFVSAPGSGTAGETVALADVLQSELVFYGEQSVGWRAARDAALATGLPLAAERHVGSIAVWRELLCRGLGTSIAPSAAVADEYRQGMVAVRQIEGAHMVRRVGLGVRRELLAERWAPALIDFMEELVKNSPAGPIHNSA